MHESRAAARSPPPNRAPALPIAAVSLLRPQPNPGLNRQAQRLPAPPLPRGLHVLTGRSLPLPPPWIPTPTRARAPQTQLALNRQVWPDGLFPAEQAAGPTRRRTPGPAFLSAMASSLSTFFTGARNPQVGGGVGRWGA